MTERALPSEARKDRLRTLTILGILFIAVILGLCWYWYQQSERQSDRFSDCMDRGHSLEYCLHR